MAWQPCVSWASPRFISGRPGVWSIGSSLRQIRRHRLRPMFWDVMAQDWKKHITKDEIIRRLQRRTQPGDILCLHDGRGAEGAPDRTIEALQVLLPHWLEQGFRFQTLERYA